MKIVSVVGARPQFIKLAPLDKVIKKLNNHVIIHTGQHYDNSMSKVFFDELEIPTPDYNLGVGSATPAAQTSKMIYELEKVLSKEKPELTIVYGDTNSTLAATIVSLQAHIPVAHVEAGPRNKKIDIPEMLNRLVADRLSSLLFCATKQNLENLEIEGMGKSAHFVGDLMYDVFVQMEKLFTDRNALISKLGIAKGEYHVATCHRAENTDSKRRLEAITEAFCESNENIVFSLHPRTKKMLEKFGLYYSLEKSNNVFLIPPQGYLDFMALSNNAKKIITDSGGLQREAYFLKKPCVNIYDHTYWPEIEKDGWQEVTGMNKNQIVKSIRDFEPKKVQNNIFGYGNAAEKISNIINSFDMKSSFDFNPGK